jgi:hypothetical protein
MKKEELRQIIKEELKSVLSEGDFYYAMEAVVVTNPSSRGQTKQFPVKSFEEGMKQAIALSKKVRAGKSGLKGEVPFIWMVGPDKIGVTHWDEEYEHHLDVENHFGGESGIMRKVIKTGDKVGTTGPPKIVKL